MATLNPYLSFRDNAREAMEFYQSVLGGDLNVMTFDGFDDMGIADDEKSLVMHAQLSTPDGFTLMGSDTPSTMPYTQPSGVSISISGDDEARLRGFWDGLAAGGTVVMPLDTPPWGGLFGMLTDRHGVDWMVSIGDDQ